MHVLIKATSLKLTFGCSRIISFKGSHIKINFQIYIFFYTEKIEKKAADDDEKRLLRNLLSKSDAEIRPVEKKTDTVRVKFGISLHQIIEVVSFKTFRQITIFIFN